MCLQVVRFGDCSPTNRVCFTKHQCRSGMVPTGLIAEMHATAARELHPCFVELVQQTPDPFIQAIVDVVVPRMAFDRVCLVGDAAFVLRPHPAAATAKAAADAMALAEAIRANPDRSPERAAGMGAAAAEIREGARRSSDHSWETIRRASSQLIYSGRCGRTLPRDFAVDTTRLTWPTRFLPQPNAASPRRRA